MSINDPFNQWSKPLINYEEQKDDICSGLSDSFSSLSIKPATLKVQKPLVAKNVHLDDIHGLIHGGKGEFVSGSKDGCVKIWNDKGRLLKTVLDKKEIKYTEWITALTPFNQDSFISGTRDGKIAEWSNKGDLICELDAPTNFKNTSRTSKQRNIGRITCLSADTTTQTIFVGRPCHFTVHSYEKNGKCKLITSCETSENDWVYCIHKVAEKNLLVVTGDKLDVWSNPEKNSWKKTSLIQPQTNRGEQRPFISALTPLSHDNKKSFGLSIFDGSVSCFDIEAGKEFFKATEHKNRVWMIENIMPKVFASCGDDHTIKLWDIRTKSSLKTLSDNVGRVSVLLSLNDKTLISGSCPDDVYRAKNKAEFTFWDIRK